MKVARNFQALLERRWMGHCLSHPHSITAVNYSPWVRISKISLIACFSPYSQSFPLKREMNVVCNYLYVVKAAGRSISCTWTSGIRSSLRRREPAAVVSMVTTSGTGDLTLVTSKPRLALKHSKKQLQEVFRETLTVRSLQADNEAGLRALGHQYRWASNSPVSLPDMTRGTGECQICFQPHAKRTDSINPSTTKFSNPLIWTLPSSEKSPRWRSTKRTIRD